MVDNRVVWSEGLFIQQQHFQQLDRSLDCRLARLSTLSAEWFWGFAALDLDAGMADVGKVGLRSAIGILTDGAVFSFPDSLRLPVPIDIPNDVRDEMVYLALPLVLEGRATHAYQGKGATRSTRYRVTDLSVVDVFDAQLAIDMALAEENYQLLLARDMSAEFIGLPIACVGQKLTDGRLQFDPFLFRRYSIAIMCRYVNASKNCWVYFVNVV